MQYACRMEVDHEPKIVKYERHFEIGNDYMTLYDLAKYIKEGEKFSFYEVEQDYLHDAKIFISIIGERLETPEEVEARVKRRINYNKGYEEFHKKYPKKEKLK